MEQIDVRKTGKQYGGANLDDFWDGCSAARKILGERCKERGTSLMAFPYLYRKFGQPVAPYDDYKTIAEYHLTTQMDGVLLSVMCKADSLDLCIGYLAERSLNLRVIAYNKDLYDRFVVDGNVHQDLIDEAFKATERGGAIDKWKQAVLKDVTKWAEHGFPQKQLDLLTKAKTSLEEALRSFLDPVSCRDIEFNVFGPLSQ